MLYMLTDICESTAADTNQRKIPNKVLDCYKFVSIWWIQLEQYFRRWLESLYLCSDSSACFGRSQQSVNQEISCKLACLVN